MLRNKRKYTALSVVLILSMLLEITHPIIARAVEKAEGQASNETIQVLDEQEPEEEVTTPTVGIYKVNINALNEQGQNFLYGDYRYFTVNGQKADGSAVSIITHTDGAQATLDLPQGEYTINGVFNQLYSYNPDNPIPNYYFTRKINITKDSLPEQTIDMGGENLATLTLDSSSATTNDYFIPAISIYPEGMDKSPIIYTQRKDQGMRKIYITPGTYTIVAALSDGTYTYFLQKQITLSEKQSLTLSLDDNFTSTLSAAKYSYDKGEVVNLIHEIKDSYGNRLIAKTKDLPVTYDKDWGSEEPSWANQAPMLKIFNSENIEIYQLGDPGNNKEILGRWYGWSYYGNSSPMVDKLNTNTTFYTGSYTIPDDIAGGIYTARLDLGEGPHTLQQNPVSFLVRGEESAPVLYPIASPTNARELTIKGSALPGSQIGVYYTLDGGEKTIIETVQASAENGNFEVNFTPPREGTYSFTAENSVPVTVVIDWTSPGKPENLNGVSTENSVNLTWEAPSGETVTKYEIYRDGTLLSQVSGTGYTDTGLESNKEYNYEVVSVDQAGNKSEASTLTIRTDEKIELELTSVKWKGS